MSRLSKALRTRVPRSSFGTWSPAPERRDPIDILREQERSRIPALLPILHGRMLESPYSFYRGNAAIMAADLARVTTTGLRVQLCGDAHLSNFGGYMTAEGRLIFDVNDFDETLPGPWEWDLMRLCGSIPVACSSHRFAKSTAEAAIEAASRAYCEGMRRYARMAPLDIWYARIDAKRLLRSEITMAASAERLLPKLASEDGHGLRFVDKPPLFRGLDDADTNVVIAHGVLRTYRLSLPVHVRELLDRYHLVDLAMKIVGVGSVGTLCLVALFLADEDQPLLLQLKEAQTSVYEAHLPKSAFENHGERIAVGQRLMQAASDLFLGWTNDGGRDYYVRQLRDMKASVDLDAITPEHLIEYAAQCGSALARGHARTGEPAAIAEYLGSGKKLVEAMVRFAFAYAEQVEHDYSAFLQAMKTGALSSLSPREQ